MSTTMREVRSPVMTMVEVSWEDRSGSPQTAAARMEDRSISGACIRMKMAIGVGSRLRIGWRFDQFSGVCKYCRREGHEYVVGILRDSLEASAASSPALEASPQSMIQGRNSPADAPKNQSESQGSGENHSAQMRAEASPVVGSGLRSAKPRRQVHEERNHEADHSAKLENLHREVRSRHSKTLVNPRRTQIRTSRPSEPREDRNDEDRKHKERKSMASKWLELALGHNKQPAKTPGAHGSAEEKGSGNAHQTPREKRLPIDGDEGELAVVAIELLPVEEIYRAAGITNPRTGYGIAKVIEMLHSDHVRGLSAEMKRAAVLMALDASGTALDQVQRDAKARQEALDSYEAAQARQVAAEWARKAEEDAQTEAELERIKQQYAARIARNHEEVEREKTAVNEWLSAKKEASDNLSEALELCMKLSPPGTGTALVRAAAAGSEEPPSKA